MNANRFSFGDCSLAGKLSHVILWLANLAVPAIYLFSAGLAPSATAAKGLHMMWQTGWVCGTLSLLGALAGGFAVWFRQDRTVVTGATLAFNAMAAFACLAIVIVARWLE